MGRFCCGIGFVMIWFSVQAFAAEQAEITVTIHPEIVPVHRYAFLSVMVQHNSDVEVLFPEKLTVTPGLVATPDSIQTREMPDKRQATTMIWLIDPVAANPGIYTIGPIEIPIEDGQVVRHEGVTLEVREMTQEEQMKALHFVSNADLIDPPVGLLRSAWLWILAVVSLLLSMLFILWKFRKSRQLPEETLPVSVWDAALACLAELDEKNTPTILDYQAYYVALTAILRRYIEERYTIHAPEMTTPEFIEYVGESPLLTRAQVKLLGSFLRHCDRVKFAAYAPTPEEAGKGRALVEYFIRDTSHGMITGAAV